MNEYKEQINVLYLSDVEREGFEQNLNEDLITGINEKREKENKEPLYVVEDGKRIINEKAVVDEIKGMYGSKSNGVYEEKDLSTIANIYALLALEHPTNETYLEFQKDWVKASFNSLYTEKNYLGENKNFKDVVSGTFDSNTGKLNIDETTKLKLYDQMFGLITDDYNTSLNSYLNKGNILNVILFSNDIPKMESPKAISQLPNGTKASYASYLADTHEILIGDKGLDATLPNVFHEYNHGSQYFLVKNIDKIQNEGMKNQVSLFGLNIGNPYSYYFREGVFYGVNSVEVDSMNVSDDRHSFSTLQPRTKEEMSKLPLINQIYFETIKKNLKK